MNDRAFANVQYGWDFQPEAVPQRAAWFLGVDPLKFPELCSDAITHPVALVDAVTGEDLLEQADLLVFPREGAQGDGVAADVLAPLSSVEIILGRQENPRHLLQRTLNEGHLNSVRIRDVILILDNGSSHLPVGAGNTGISTFLSRIRRARGREQQIERWLQCNDLLSELDADRHAFLMGLIAAHVERLSARLQICPLRSPLERSRNLEALDRMGFASMRRRSGRPFPLATEKVAALVDLPTRPIPALPNTLGYKIVRISAASIRIPASRGFPHANLSGPRTAIDVRLDPQFVAALLNDGTAHRITLGLHLRAETRDRVVIDVIPDWDLRSYFGVAGMCGLGKKKVWIEWASNWGRSNCVEAEARVGERTEFVIASEARRRTATFRYSVDAGTYSLQSFPLG
jgi:hypothetical protein